MKGYTSAPAFSPVTHFEGRPAFQDPTNAVWDRLGIVIPETSQIVLNLTIVSCFEKKWGEQKLLE